MAPAIAAEVARLASLAFLRTTAPADSTVYTVLRSLSSRRLDLFAIRDSGPVRISWHVARALRWEEPEIGQGLRVPGRRDDLGFFTVTALAEAIHGNSDKLNLRWL